MSDDLPYWVAFNHIHGIGAIRFNILLERFGSMACAWKASPKDYVLIRLPDKVIDAIEKFKQTHDPHILYGNILARKIRVTSLFDPSYPILLKNIDTPPPLLYHVGTLPDSLSCNIAVVGTRKMTNYGQEMAREFGAFFARNQITLISGLARGIDGTAHQAVLDNGGRTCAVLGCGVDRIYPPEHRTLAKEMIQNGAILSDYAPGTPPFKDNFPPRNRIISGMSCAVLVIEAGEKSGSLITARFAAEQGREVFALPGNYNALQSRGTNRIIRDGARPLYEKEEILEFLKTTYAKIPAITTKPLQMSFLEADEKLILDAITTEELHIDEIARKIHLSVSKISSILMMMEIKGFVCESAPNTFIRKNDLF